MQPGACRVPRTPRALLLRIPLDAIFETVFAADAICLIANAQQFAFNITFVTAGS